MRVAFVHTVSGVLETFKRDVAQHFPDLDAFHVLNEGLLQELLRGRDPEQVFGALADQLILLQDLGTDLIMCTCSSTSPGVALARPRLWIPIVRIDDPMASLAVESSSTIGLLCTASSALEASTQLLRDHATIRNRSVVIESRLVSAAHDALTSGDENTHDLLVTDAAVELASGVETLVLAQASLAHLQEPLSERLGIPVLASPPLLLRELRSRLDRIG